MRLQFRPDTHDQVFDGTHFAFHEINILIQVAMIQLFNDVLIDDLAEFFRVEDESGIGIWVPFDGDEQFEVMSMPVGIGTFAKYLLIFLQAPVGVEQLMSRIKMFYSCQVNHSGTIKAGKVKKFEWCPVNCSMQILLVASTSLEIKPFMAQIRSRDFGTISRHELDILITGVGLMASTYAISRQVHLKRPDLVIQAGLAGSFDPLQYPIGSLVVVGKEWVADLGVKEKGKFRDLFGLGLIKPNQFPFKKGCLINPELKRLKEVGLPVVNGVSVNAITHSPSITREYITRYKPAVESMEGAALHYTCLMEGLPFIQLRAVSNKVGDRNKQKWDIPGAVDRLNKGLLYLIQSI